MNYETRLQDAFMKLEDVMQHYEKIVKDEDEGTSETKANSTRTLRTIKVLLKQKKQLFHDHTLKTSNEHLPNGHVVSLFYKRSPIESYTYLQTEPIQTKPWLSYQVRN